MQDVRGSTRDRPGPDGPVRRRWLSRLAGGLLLVVGVGNAAFGVLSLFSDAVRLSPGSTGGLIVVGLATIGLGVAVWRGSRRAVTVGLTVFGLLLIAQLGDVSGPSDAGDQSVLRFLVLGLLVGSLALARFGAGRP